MTEQELEKKIRQSGVEDRESVEYFVELTKAYADARESETKRQLGLCNLMQSAATDMLCAKDDEIAELEAKNAALVAALEEIAGFHTDEPTQIWANDALAANEKGGSI